MVHTCDDHTSPRLSWFRPWYATWFRRDAWNTRYDHVFTYGSHHDRPIDNGYIFMITTIFIWRTYMGEIVILRRQDNQTYAKRNTRKRFFAKRSIKGYDVSTTRSAVLFVRSFFFFFLISIFDLFGASDQLLYSASAARS